MQLKRKCWKEFAQRNIKIIMRARIMARDFLFDTESIETWLVKLEVSRDAGVARIREELMGFARLADEYERSAKCILRDRLHY